MPVSKVIKQKRRITYTVKVTDYHGNVVTDLETVEVQRKGHNDTEWPGTELTLNGDLSYRNIHL